jgi:phospho-N-acetylmuramoyl-pentapeptide-transferase
MIRYMITLSILIPGLAGFVVAVILTYFLIPILKRMAGQNIREEGPQAHKAKAGTPSMGGMAIIAAIIVAYLCGRTYTGSGAMIVLCLLLFGAIGFLDDWLKVVKKQNEGLKAWQKFGLQFLVAIGIAVYVAVFSELGTDVYIPFAKRMVDFGGWYIPFIVFTILAMVNAVNLTDGLDGLASGVTAIVAFAMTLLAIHFTAAILDFSATMSMAGTTGACLGFLVWNRNPAKVFMGDTGSLALGGVITGAAIAMKMELLLPIMGLIYVLEVLSVCIQVSYFKATHGRRLFRMTPLHHHFELSGMSERKVVAMFWIATGIFCCVGMLAAW